MPNPSQKPTLCEVILERGFAEQRANYAGCGQTRPGSVAELGKHLSLSIEQPQQLLQLKLAGKDEPLSRQVPVDRSPSGSNARNGGSREGSGSSVRSFVPISQSAFEMITHHASQPVDGTEYSPPSEALGVERRPRAHTEFPARYPNRLLAFGKRIEVAVAAAPVFDVLG
jgi:hypothetical protein